MSKEAESKKAEQELQKLRKLPENRQCANCLAPGAPLLTAVVMPFRIFVCSSCKSAHQSFSHRCKSTQMSLWTMEEVRTLEDRNGGGNRAAQDRWLRYVKDSDRPRERDSDDRFKDFVRRAYIDQRWAAQGEEEGRGRSSGGRNPPARGRAEEESDRREGERRRDRGGGGGGGIRSAGGRDRREEDFFDPDAGGGRRSADSHGGGVRKQQEVDFFNPDLPAAGSRGKPAPDFFDPDASRVPSQSYTAAPAQADFNPDAPAAGGAAPFNAFASGAPQPPQPWASTPGIQAPQGGGFLNFDPLGPGPAPAAAPPPASVDLFDSFVSAAPAPAAAAPQPQPQAGMTAGGCAGPCNPAAAQAMGGVNAAWGYAGAPMAQQQQQQPCAQGQLLQGAGVGMMQGTMGQPMQGQQQGLQQGQWGASQGGVPPHPALGGSMQPGWQQLGFPGAAAPAWAGLAGSGTGTAQAPAMYWGQAGVPCQAPQPHCAQFEQQQQQQQTLQQPQQSVCLEDLKQNLHQLYAS